MFTRYWSAAFVVGFSMHETPEPAIFSAYFTCIFAGICGLMMMFAAYLPSSVGEELPWQMERDADYTELYDRDRA